MQIPATVTVVAEAAVKRRTVAVLLRGRMVMVVDTAAALQHLLAVEVTAAALQHLLLAVEVTAAARQRLLMTAEVTADLASLAAAGA